MTSERRKVCAVKFRSTQKTGDSHPLHALVSEASAERLGVECDECAFVAGLRKHCSENVLLVSFRIRGRGNDRIPFLADDSFPSEDDHEEIKVAVYCTSQFLSHYEIDTNETYFLQSLEVFPVQKMIIGVRHQDTLKWTQSVRFGAGLIVSVCQGKILVRENDIFLAPYSKMFLEDSRFNTSFFSDLFVLECLPVAQGILTVNTEIVVIMTDLVKGNPDSLSVKALGDQHIKQTDACAEFQKYVPCISDFVYPLSSVALNLVKSGRLKTRRNFDHVNKIVTTRDGLSVRTQSEFLINPTLVPREAIWPQILLKPDTGAGFDAMYIIGMPRRMMLKHHLFDGSVVKMSSLDHQPVRHFTQLQGITANSSPRKQKDKDYGSDVDSPDGAAEPDNMRPYNIDSHHKCAVRLAQVKMLKREFDLSKDVYASPLLLFNIHPFPSSSSSCLSVVEKFTNLYPSREVTSVSSSWDARIPIAKEVQISLVSSPNYSPATSFSVTLKKYFETPRAVSVGDVFGVRSSDDPEFCLCLGDDPETRYPVVYFKVIRIEPESSHQQTFIVDSERSALIQIGHVNSYVPRLLEVYLSKGDNLTYWEKHHPAGLEKYSESLESLILSHLSLSGSNSNIVPAILLTGPAAVGKTSVVKFVGRKLGIKVLKVSCTTLSGETPAASESRLKKILESATFLSPCILLLKHIHVLGKDREGNIEDTRVAKTFQDLLSFLSPADLPVIVIGTSTHPKLISHDIQQQFLHQITMEVPTETERAELIQTLLADTKYSSDVDVGYISQRTAGFVLGDFVALMSQMKKSAIDRLCKMCRLWPTVEQEEDLQSAGVSVQQSDIIQALDWLQSAHSSFIGAPKIPNVRWEDIGGLSEVREEILDTIQMPLQHPELLAAGLRRSGVLLYGPPGSGKTLLAKAVATECSLNFLSVKGPELINKYVGQSEENVREVFSRARDASPCVIFFDELDSLAPNRGRSGDSGGVMDRVVSQMLAELDGLHKSLDVFVIGATNRPDLLDPALLRPGRFDKPLYLGVSADKANQVKILKALTRKFTFDPKVNLEEVAEKCPMTLTGADFYALCSDAMLSALKGKIDLLESGEKVDQSTVIVSQEDFLTALSRLTPSVSEQELQHYAQLKHSLTARK